MVITSALLNEDYKYLYYCLFKSTYERWGLKDGEGKLRIETSEGE
jgi:hypothetical protein